MGLVEWISVDDKLPHPEFSRGSIFIIYQRIPCNRPRAHIHSDRCQYVVSVGGYLKDFWMDINGSLLKLEDVTHWMPLPKEPKQ